MVGKKHKREAYKLHLQTEHLIAIAHVAIQLIDLTAEQIIGRYPPGIRKHLDELTTPANIALIKEDLIRALPEHKNALSEFVSEITSARFERNDIHATWRPTETPETKAIVE